MRFRNKKTMENNNHNKLCCGNPWFILKILGMILIAAIVIVSLMRERFVNRPEWQLNFTGQAKINYEPDIANINIGVQVDRKTQAEIALKELDEKITKILKAVEESGIKKEDIQTQNYTLSPHYDNINEITKVTGYDANQTIKIKVRDINKDKEKTSKVIAAASSAGANQINSISFEPSNLEDLKQEARLKAILDAKKKAKTLSRTLGVRLCKIVNWWENYNPPATPYYSDMGAGMGIGGGGGATPVVPSGMGEINMEVNIGYNIR